MKPEQADSITPLYEQLYDDISSKIATRKWKPGRRIPTEMELCKQYNVSRITVRKALEELVRTGVLIRQRGKGTYVQMEHIENELSKFYSFSEHLRSRGINELAEVLDFEEVPVAANMAKKLDLKETSDLVYKIIRLRSVDDVPYAVETSYIPKSIYKGLTADAVGENGLYNTMRAIGPVPDRARETFKATALGGLESRLLQQDLHCPVMSIERITYSGNTVVEYCHSTVSGDFFVYSVELGDV